VTSKVEENAQAFTSLKAPSTTPKASASRAASFQRRYGRRAADQLLITAGRAARPEPFTRTGITMRKDTRFKFNAYLSRVAELNGVSTDDVAKKFTVEPSVTQTLMTTLQMSSAFLTKINIVPVDELKGEKVGVGVNGTIASTADTAGDDERKTADFTALESNKYECAD
jgi:hypothetical protein